MVLSAVSLLFLIIFHYSLYNSAVKVWILLLHKGSYFASQDIFYNWYQLINSKFFFPYGRYRLAGLPGEYQYKNITSAEINYCLVKDLIIWTQYEIQVASYNGAGLGAFSRPVTEYTLQGGEQIGTVCVKAQFPKENMHSPIVPPNNCKMNGQFSHIWKTSLLGWKEVENTSFECLSRDSIALSVVGKGCGSRGMDL